MWKAQRFSWRFTTALHTLPESLPYDQKLQDTGLAHPFLSERALGSLAENYVVPHSRGSETYDSKFGRRGERPESAVLLQHRLDN